MAGPSAEAHAKALQLRRLKPRKFRVQNCSGLCSLGDRQQSSKVASLIHQWLEEGHNNQEIVRRAKELSIDISEGATGRHRRNHLVALGPDELEAEERAAQAEADPGRPLSDIEILESVISRGAASLRLPGQKVSAEMLMRAMELKYKLTQGNAFQGFLDAVNSAFDEEDGPPEDPDASQSADEQAQALPED